MEQISKDLKKKISPILQFNEVKTQMADKLSGFTKAIDLSGIREGLEKIRQGALETEKDLKVFKGAITELGYPPHDGMDLSTMRGIAQAYTKDKESLLEVIDDIMCDYYDSGLLIELSSYWEDNPIIKERIPILRNVIMAHNQGMHWVSVPTILSQFEGVLVDAFGINGKVDGGIINILLKGLLKDTGTPRTIFEEEVLDYYEKNILVGFEHGKLIGSEISRNAILHGADKNYGKQTSSLKAILLFDYIASKVTSIGNQRKQDVKGQVREYRRLKRIKRNSKKRRSVH